MLLATIRTFVGVVKLLQRVEYLMKELIIMTLFRGPPLYYVYLGICHSGGEWGVNACLDGFEHLSKKPRFWQTTFYQTQLQSLHCLISHSAIGLVEFCSRC